MTKRQNRDTYLREDEVVQRVIDTSEKIARFLSEQRPSASDERARMQLDTLVDLQNQLTAKIAEYRDKAPWQFKETYMQYVDPGSGKVDRMIRDTGELHNADEFAQTAVALNGQLAQELEPIGENAGVEESADAFENLKFLVEENCRKISFGQSMSGDM